MLRTVVSGWAKVSGHLVCGQRKLHELKGRGDFGGGGDSVTVHQTMYFGSDVTQATLRTWAAQVQRQTEASIIAKRKRGDASVKAAFG